MSATNAGERDEPLQPWLVQPLMAWLHPFLCWSRAANERLLLRRGFVADLALAVHERVPFENGSVEQTLGDIESRLRTQSGFGVGALEFALAHVDELPDAAGHVARLNEILRMGGSPWEAVATEAGWRLARSELGPATAAVHASATLSERAHGLLQRASEKISARDPDPDGAYDLAVKAVEAAAHPVVSPGNGRATLGTMIRDLRTKPAKWRFALGDVELVIAMSERLWTSHIRHGTGPRTAHTAAEADAALHLAIPLVRFFAGGLVARVDEPHR